MRSDTYRSSRSHVFYKIARPKSFLGFRGKHLQWRPCSCKVVRPNYTYDRLFFVYMFWTVIFGSAIYPEVIS